MEIGSRVEISTPSNPSLAGTVRYLGETAFAAGNWVGIELDTPNGKNDGSVQGQRYFDCEPLYGVFVRSSQIKKVLPANSRNTPEHEDAANASLSPTARPGALASRTPPNPARQGIAKPPPLTASRTARTPIAKTSSSSSTPPPASSTSSSSATSARKLGTSATKARPKVPSNVPKGAESPVPSPATSPTAFIPISANTESIPPPDTAEMPLILDLKNASTPETAEEPLEIRKEGSSPAIVSLASSPSKLEDTLLVKELQAKVRVLEEGILEDKERLRQTEKLRAELENMTIAKAALQDKLHELQSEVRDLKRLQSSLQEEKDDMEAQLADAHEAMEMLTLDKEFAEEKADSLQNENVNLKEKVEELSIELEVLKEENQLDESGDAQSNDSVVLLRQNERLKEALINSRQEAEYKETIQQLQQDLSTVATETNSIDKMRESLARAEQQIESLSESLDNALGAERMVEHLTDKNLELGEKVEELKAAIADLEALKELNDELEENHVLTEKELQAEIELKDRANVELKSKIASQEGTISDHEHVIFQFRNLVRTLQSDIEDLRRVSNNPTLADTEALSSQTQEMLSLNLKLQTSELKHKAKSIETDLKELEGKQAQLHLEIVKHFLPETFFNEEHDPILAVLLLRRIIFKCNLIKLYFEESRARFEEADKVSIYYEILDKVTRSQSLSRFLQAILENCNASTFAAFGSLYHDLVGPERRLNSLLEMVKKDDIQEAQILDDINKVILQVERVAENSNTAENASVGVFYNVFGLNERFLAASERLLFEIGRFDKVFTPLDSDDVELRTELEIIKVDYLKNIPDIVKKVDDAKVVARRLSKKLTDAGESYVLPAEFVAKLKHANAQAAKAIDYASVLIGNVANYNKDRLEMNMVPTLPILLQLSTSASEALLGIGESAMGDGLKHILSDLPEMLESVLEGCNSLSEKVTKLTSPWIVRAEAIKANYSLNAGMQSQVDSLNDEVVALIKEVKKKEQMNQELLVKINLLEKKVENVKKYTETIANLEELVAKSKEKEQEYTEMIEQLNEENMNIEQENLKFKKLVNRPEKTASPRRPLYPGADIESATTPLSTASVSAANAVSPLPYSSGMDLQESLEFLMDGNIAAQI
ncbi:hypothetical protein HDU97_008768 [Phlyctochytrium planicorne]|nr:hypothetical protein HDU97_008768 [Phlyctochytrium planicorne]